MKRELEVFIDDTGTKLAIFNSYPCRLISDDKIKRVKRRLMAKEYELALECIGDEAKEDWFCYRIV